MAKTRKLTDEQKAKNRVRRYARNLGAVRYQWSDHGCGERSLQAFDARGRLVYDNNY